MRLFKAEPEVLTTVCCSLAQVGLKRLKALNQRKKKDFTETPAATMAGNCYLYASNGTVILSRTAKKENKSSHK